MLRGTSPASPFCRRHNVRIVGDAGPTLVLGNGFGTDQDVWNAILPWLSQHFRVVLYDLACSGRVSGQVFDLRRHRSLEGYAEDLRSIASELGLTQACYLGHSMSGMIGLLASTLVPGLFRRLVMIAPSARYLDDGAYKGGFTPDGLKEVYDAIAHRYGDWARAFAPVATAAVAGSAAAEQFLHSLLSMRPDIALWTARTIFESDFRGQLGSFGVPVTILQSEQDPAVPIEAARFMLAGLPDARLEVLPVSGHLPHLTHPEVVIEALAHHLPG